MNQISRSSFDPCSIWPSRIKDKKWKASPHDKSGGVGGATDLKKREAFLPTANTAYDRTIRLHEALHAIYTPPPTKERIKSGKGYTMLEQALEDARLHLNCAKTEGIVRRDELATALRDLHNSIMRKGSGYACGGDSKLCALMALRAGAILMSQDSTTTLSAKRLQQLCDLVAPDYKTKMLEALERIEANEMLDAHRILEPYFEGDAKPESKVWPSAGKGDKDGKVDIDKGDADVSFDKLDGKLTSEAADMLGPDRARDLKRSSCVPHLRIHQLFANHMIPTFFGETEKHVISGTKIHAKKLACIVGPTAPKVFLKTTRRNGGTVVIDASGSMDLSETQLLELLVKAPAATLAFYNATSDTDYKHGGNMWIFAHKGKRALDLREIPKSRYDIKSTNPDDKFSYYCGGNMVDFQVLQWLLAQPAPRYILTDGKFTGPTAGYGRELLSNAIARKKITQITSLAEMQKVLAKGGQ